ncbi:MAG: helix-turn-helix transcriptional regulator [Kangiellaceae bacterium]|nr:helix-turn-helix transcriptional regulator [Kangiellaceae bacterium]
MPQKSAKIRNSLIENQSVCFDIDRTYSNIEYHYSDMIEKTDDRVVSERKPGITLGILIEGKLDFTIDHQPIKLEVANASTPICFGYNFAKPAQWKRRLIKNNRVKKLIITIPQQWINNRLSGDSNIESMMYRFLQTHAELISSTADSKTIELANSFFRQPRNNISKILLESLSLQFIISGLSVLSLELPDKSVSDQYRITKISKEAIKIRSHIEKYCLNCEVTEKLTLTEIAYGLGASVSTLQRQFRHAFSITIGEYIRSRRLELAKEQLELGLNIGEVAYQAGYKHTSNFTSAFRKRFGETPGSVCFIR